MIILDFLFNICFAPFQKVKKNGRLAALIWLTPALTFLLMGLFNTLFYLLFGSVSRVLDPLLGGVFIITIFVFLSIVLDKIYLSGNRAVGEIKFLYLYYFLLPMFFFGSLIFCALTAYEFN
jgi:hypothetical protein